MQAMQEQEKIQEDNQKQHEIEFEHHSDAEDDVLYDDGNLIEDEQGNLTYDHKHVQIDVSANLYCTNKSRCSKV
jgi:hypothetical protein